MPEMARTAAICKSPTSRSGRGGAAAAREGATARVRKAPAEPLGEGSVGGGQGVLRPRAAVGDDRLQARVARRRLDQHLGAEREPVAGDSLRVDVAAT